MNQTTSSSRARGAAVQIFEGTDARPDLLGALIKDAFRDLGPCGFLVPNPDDLDTVLTGFFILEVTEAQQHGIVDITADAIGVALWHMRTGVAPAEPESTDGLEQATGIYAPNFLRFNEILASHHPTGRPHAYLEILAVHPSAQHTGLGTALLEHRHRELDASNTPAYLEAAGDHLVGYYEAFGYRRMPGQLIELPGVAPMIPMWREPQAP